MSPAASTRWCPTPEQVMILEEMYRSGVRTPNAAQIQQITAHLSLYGKIEGKNVFYWFQNHKARDRQKLRKKILGKQLQQQHQQMMFSHHHHVFPSFDHSQNFHHHSNLLQNLPPPPPLAPPCCAPTASSLGLFHHQLPPVNSSTCLGAHQARAVDVVPRMTTSHAWNMETSEHPKYGMRENAKPMMRMIPNDHHDHDDWMMMRKSGEHHHNVLHNDNDWMMMRKSEEHHYNNVRHNDNVNDNDNDNDDDSRRPIKTLELFPIKDKASLKEDATNYLSLL